MLEIWQIAAVTLLAFLVPIDKYGLTIGLRWPIITGLILGFILGDMKTALFIGGTLELMALGVTSIAGSSVPEYSTAAIIAIVIASQTGQSMEAGLALGLPVAMLGVQFDVVAKIINGFIVRKSQIYANAGQFARMKRILLLGPVIMGLTAAIPVLLAITLGATAIKEVLTVMPAWFSNGLTIAGRVLPAVGIALLLNYMPVKRYFQYLLAGFFFVAWLNVPILGVTVVGLIAAIHYYSKNDAAPASATTNEILDDE